MSFSEMSPRERLLTALDRKEPDRVPIHAAFTPEAAEKFKNRLIERGILSGDFEGGTPALSAAAGNDLLVEGNSIGGSFYGSGGDEYTCRWGITWHKVSIPGGSYMEIKTNPLADSSLISDYKCPDPLEKKRFDCNEKLLSSYGKTHGVCGFMGSILFEPAWYLRGYENFLTDLMVEKDNANIILDKLFDFQLATGIKLAEIGIDVLWLGDDFGTQHSLIMSPETWREFFKERYTKLFHSFKSVKKDIKIAFHSDGNVEKLIPDLMDTGVDILQAVQPKSMDVGSLKKKFGNKLSFWGTVDIQEIMPFGTPDDVRNEVKTRIFSAGKGGGLIIAPSHNIQPDVSVENIEAFYDAAKKYGRYPIG